MPDLSADFQNSAEPLNVLELRGHQGTQLVARILMAFDGRAHRGQNSFLFAHEARVDDLVLATGEVVINRRLADA